MKRRGLILLIALFVAMNALPAQDTRSPWHTVRGLVVDELGRPAMAIVYLRDLGGHRLRMKHTDRSGRFNFGFVNTNIKYEIYAEQEGLTSQRLPIVADQSKRELILKLTLSKPTKK